MEDDKDTAEVIKTILEIGGYNVDLAFSGKEGLAKIKSNDYDLALLDIMMPDMSGWDLYQKVKGKNTKFAFLSALPVSSERFDELKKAGLSDYITKPFTKKSLLERVGKILK